MFMRKIYGMIRNSLKEIMCKTLTLLCSEKHKSYRVCVHAADVFNFTKINGVTVDLLQRNNHIQCTEFTKPVKFSGTLQNKRC